MKVNVELRNNIFEVLEKQIKANNPPETKINFNRLIKEGYSKFEAKQLLGQCLILEIFQVMKFDEKVDEKRYIRNMNNLPDEPQE